MAQISLTGLIKLIDASEALGEAKKAELKAKLPKLSDSQQAEIYNILIGEQQFLANHYRQVGQIKTHAAEKKIKLIYDTAEKKLNQDEASDIEELENQMANL